MTWFDVDGIINDDLAVTLEYADEAAGDGISSTPNIELFLEFDLTRNDNTDPLLDWFLRTTWLPAVEFELIKLLLFWFKDGAADSLKIKNIRTNFKRRIIITEEKKL